MLENLAGVTLPTVSAGAAGGAPLEVRLRRLQGVDVLQAAEPAGGVLGHYNPLTARLYVVDPQNSLAVAAAVAPYLFGADQAFGQLSHRHLAGAEKLWSLLEAGAFTWHRAVPLRDRLLPFYCPIARLVLDIVDDGEVAADVHAPTLEHLGLSRAVVPLRELEQQPEEVAGWLSAVCTHRAGSRPGARPKSAVRGRVRGLRAPRM